MSAVYDFVLGTGGVGKGILFKLIGNHDLGRNESRLGVLSDDQDYCKLHIILNYVAALSDPALPVYAISRVGDDPTGHELISCMNETGINTDFLKRSAAAPTMFSVCYQFPGGEGGNITTENAANNLVSEEDILSFFEAVNPQGRGMALAAPEVPMAARLCLLRESKQRGFTTIASVLSGEIEQFQAGGGFRLTDLLSINEDEAQGIAAFAGSPSANEPGRDCYNFIKAQNPAAALAVTCGSKGSTVFHNDQATFVPAIAVKPVNTAGAGDCFLGTLMACLIRGLPLTTKKSGTPSAQKTATLAAALKVQCKDTIDFSLNLETLSAFAQAQDMPDAMQIKG